MSTLPAHGQHLFGIGGGALERLAQYPESMWLILFGFYISRGTDRGPGVALFGGPASGREQGATFGRRCSRRGTARCPNSRPPPPRHPDPLIPADHPFGVMDVRWVAGSPGGMRARAGRAWVLLACAAAIAVVALAGCGSSKPAYCTDRANLENSVKGLSNLSGSGISGLKSQITQIQSDATAVVNSAKGDFPTQTSAISSSVSALKNSLTGLPSSPSVAQVATVTKDAASVVSAVKTFSDATSSQCS